MRESSLRLKGSQERPPSPYSIGNLLAQETVRLLLFQSNNDELTNLTAGQTAANVWVLRMCSVDCSSRNRPEDNLSLLTHSLVTGQGSVIEYTCYRA
jgi:hypothetical protein